MSPAPDAQPAAPLPGQNWQHSTELADLEATEAYAQQLAAQLQPGDLLVLTGGLGAGKTTFTKALGKALGIEGQVSSPTFVLSRIHRNREDTGPDLVHVDTYRTDAEGLESLDLAAHLAESVVVIEWGRALVEEALLGTGGSWLDLELQTPELENPETQGDDDAETPMGVSRPSTGAEIQTDFSESEEDILGTPRLAVLRGYGPRWESDPQISFA